MAAVINDHKYGGLKQHKNTILHFWGQKTKVSFTGQKSGWVLPEVLGKSVFTLSLTSGGHLRPLSSDSLFTSLNFLLS